MAEQEQMKKNGAGPDSREAGRFDADAATCCPLFRGLSPEAMLCLEQAGCLRRQRYEKNSMILHAGTVVAELGIVLSGGVRIECVDLWGNCSILGYAGAGEIFAETYALCGAPLRVDAVASEDTEVQFFHLVRFMAAGLGGEPWYGTVLQRLLSMTAAKNLALSGRIMCTSSRHVRSRVLSYLSMQAMEQATRSFEIPFNRQQMADYLNLDRSALSKTLCELRDEGVLRFRKNRFELLNGENEAFPEGFAGN